MPRVVLDNCVPRTLLPHLALSGATTVGDLGWADVDDGPLHDLLAGVCDVFITVDRSLQFQQRLDTRPFATVVMAAQTNRVSDLLPLANGVREAVAHAIPGQVLHVSR